MQNQLPLLSPKAYLWLKLWAIEMLLHGGAAAPPCLPEQTWRGSPPCTEQFPSLLGAAHGRSGVELTPLFYLWGFLLQTRVILSIYFTPSVKDTVPPKETKFALFSQWMETLFNSIAQSEQDSAAPAPTHFFFSSQQELSIGVSPTESFLVVFSQAKKKTHHKTKQKRKIKRKKKTDLKEDC